MDHDVVVEPAQQYKAIGVVVSAMGTVDHVVRLQSVAGLAAVCLAGAIAEEHEVPDALRGSA